MTKVTSDFFFLSECCHFFVLDYCTMQVYLCNYLWNILCVLYKQRESSLFWKVIMLKGKSCSMWESSRQRNWGDVWSIYIYIFISFYRASTTGKLPSCYMLGFVCIISEIYFGDSLTVEWGLHFNFSVQERSLVHVKSPAGLPLALSCWAT